MVGEFDDLQGAMGRDYALNDGEDPEVAEAIFEQYLPRFSGDTVPTTDIGATLALADRLDSLVGIFSIGQQPSGSRDPFRFTPSESGRVKNYART
jgi:glycyl-tRNA synthetase beta chain